MSFNYTPPPDEVIRNGQIASYVLYASLVFVPNVKIGAAIGGLGSAIIAWKVASYAGGDMGGLSQIINPPIQFVVGALIGAFISFISKSIFQLFRKRGMAEDISVEQPEQDAS